MFGCAPRLWLHERDTIVLYAKVVQSSFLEEPKREEGLSPPYRQRKLLRVLMRAKSERRSLCTRRETGGVFKLIFIVLVAISAKYESSESLVQQKSDNKRKQKLAQSWQAGAKCKVHKIKA